MQNGHKVIAFAGVMEVMVNECRLLNLSTVSKSLLEDCEHSEQSVSYKEIVKDHYFKFNVMKTDVMEDIKRIKAVKLYPGKSLGDGKQTDVVGGIEIIYETKSGNDHVDGIIDLYCKTFDVEPETLELKDNEYITSIYGTGKEYIKTLNIETNFYRKVK